MSTKYFLILLALLGGLILIGGVNQNKNIPTVAAPAAQTKTMGAVEVEARLIAQEESNDKVINLKFTTHSVELDYDMRQVASLTDDLGKIYPVIGWSGGQGGHHLNGELSFGEMDKNAKIIKLRLSGIDNAEAEFEFPI